MNCEKIKESVSIRTVLESFNLLPAKENRKTAFYFALDREEKIPSLSVDFVNDHNGKASKKMIQNDHDNVEDCSLFYIDFKDLNEWFCNFNEKL